MQEHQTTHPEAVIPSHKLTRVDGGADIADEHDDITEAAADNILHLVGKRAENRGDDRTDIIVIFEDWAHEEWSDIDISESPVVLAGRVEDHSEDAWFARGAFYVDWDIVGEATTEELDNAWMTDIISQVDKTDEDFIDRIGATYWPKTATSGFYTVE